MGSQDAALDRVARRTACAPGFCGMTSRRFAQDLKGTSRIIANFPKRQRIRKILQPRVSCSYKLTKAAITLGCLACDPSHGLVGNCSRGAFSRPDLARCLLLSSTVLIWK